MRVIFVIPGFKVGGGEQVVRLLARHMMARHDVLVVGAFYGGQMQPLFEAERIPVVVLGTGEKVRDPLRRVLRFVRTISDLRRVFMDFRPDVIAIHILGTLRVVVVAACLVRIRTMVLTLHNTYRQFAETNLAGKLHRLEMRVLLRRMKCVIAVSEEVRDWAVNHRVISPDRVVVVRNGIDLRALQVEQSREALRERLGVPLDRIVFAHVAAMVPKKGHKNLLEAIALMPAAARERALFLLVGDGPERPHLEEQVRALGISSVVCFMGVREDVPSLLKLSDVFVLASLYEGLSMALMEAMAAGLPVVSTRTTGSTLLIEEGSNGVMMACGDPAAMAEKLAWCVTHRERLPLMGASARETVAQGFSAERMARDTEEVLFRLSAGRKS
jgi:glycosyltransferase involved in cell wall biosynthesis